jgi:ribosomal protein S18 acetylase RimI-like enzyme
MNGVRIGIYGTGCVPALKDVKQFNLLRAALTPGLEPLSHDEVRRLIAQSTVFVARTEARVIVAMARLVLQYGLTKERAEIHDMVVLQAHRGRGIARELLRTIEATAAELGFATVQLTSRPARSEANNLYRDEGYTLFHKRTNVYIKPLLAVSEWVEK